jgi:hypothetical protein
MRNLRQNAARSDVVASVCSRVPVAETEPSDHRHQGLISFLNAVERTMSASRIVEAAQRGAAALRLDGVRHLYPRQT